MEKIDFSKLRTKLTKRPMFNGLSISFFNYKEFRSKKFLKYLNDFKLNIDPFELQKTWNNIFLSMSDLLDTVADHKPHKYFLNKEEEKVLFYKLNLYKKKFNLAYFINKNYESAKEYELKIKEIRDILIVCNIALVIEMAKKYKVFFSNKKDDFITNGIGALMNSVDKFDIGIGFKFSTYVCRAIIKSFQRTSEKDKNQYASDFEIIPDQLTISYNEDKRLLIDEMIDVIKFNKANLTDVEMKVIKDRFLNANKDHNAFGLKEVGDELNLSKERIRQVQIVALNKLKNVLDKGAKKEELVNI